MRAAIYAHVCAGDPENQLRPLRRHCERRGWSIASEFVDDKFSQREAWGRVMEAGTRGEFDVVLVWSLDQVPHDRATDVFCYIAELMRCAAALLESYSEPRFSSLGPGGERVLAIAAWIAALSPIPRECKTG